MPRSPLADVKLNLVESIDDLWAMKRWAAERRETPLGFDCETSGLDPSRHKLRLIQLGDMRQGWAVPFDLWGGGALEVLRDYEYDLVGHNSPFDWRFIKTNGKLDLPWHKIHDTMVLARLDDPTRSAGLKPLSVSLVDKHADSGSHALHDGMRLNNWDWETVPVNYPAYWVYGALDPVLTCHIWHQLYPRVIETMPAAYDLELAVNRVCARMMLKGIMIDREYVLSKKQELQDFSQNVRKWLKEYHEITSPMASKQIASAFEALGLKITRFTATGQPAVDKELLEGVQAAEGLPAGVADLARAVLKVRHADKIVSTYFDGFLKTADADDVIHPQIWPMQARTGRMSISDPALQTLHRDDKVVRGAFIPRPGHALISCDASQIELRVSASLSGDANLIELLREADASGTDVYATIATSLFNETIGKGDPRRQATKSCAYTKLYGGGVSKMALVLGLPPQQARAMSDLFDNRFPGLAEFSLRLQREAAIQISRGERPHARTSLGRYLPCEKDKTYALTNYAVQSESAEILKRGLIDLAAAGYDDSLLLPVHDECVLEVPRERADEALLEIQETLTKSSSNYAVAIPWEGKVMPERWQK